MEHNLKSIVLSLNLVFKLLLNVNQNGCKGCREPHTMGMETGIFENRIVTYLVASVHRM